MACWWECSAWLPWRSYELLSVLVGVFPVWFIGGSFQVQPATIHLLLKLFGLQPFVIDALPHSTDLVCDRCFSFLSICMVWLVLLKTIQSLNRPRFFVTKFSPLLSSTKDHTKNLYFQNFIFKLLVYHAMPTLHFSVLYHKFITKNSIFCPHDFMLKFGFCCTILFSFHFIRQFWS